LRNFGAEPPESTQLHQNHKPVFAEYHFLVKKKGGKKRKKNKKREKKRERKKESEKKN
jgi:hypothetical protein